MISSIVLTGILRDNYKGYFRLVETHNIDVIDQEKDIISLIPVAYWTKETNNLLFKAPYGAHVVIKGHLETDVEVGLYIVVEIIEVQ